MMIGKAPWNKGKKGLQVAWNKGKTGYSVDRSNYRASIETKEKIRNALKGRRLSLAVREKMSKTALGRPKLFARGRRPWNWKGGRSSVRKQIMSSLEYKIWRRGVFERDKYTCVWCGQVGGELNADHIKPFRDYPELRLALDNGRTLCVSCHKKTETYGNKYKIKK